MNFSAGNIIGGLLFSGIGYVAFTYGRRNDNVRVMALGGALMAYSYFISNTVMVYVVGAALTAAIFFFKD